MGNLTKNFSRKEFACKCGCGLDTIDYETVKILQDTCDYFSELLNIGKVICIIHSGARCVSHNVEVGGSKGSQHLKCRAVDFHIQGIHPGDVYRYLDIKYGDKYGIGKYTTFTHLDTRKEKARWKG